MIRFETYSGRFQDVRGSVIGLPGWARMVLFLLALPGIALAALSIVGFVVSLLALLLLTVPAYRLLRALSGGGIGRRQHEQADYAVRESEPGRRHIDVKIVE